jgi:small redox-active disulfide protein 2
LKTIKVLGMGCAKCIRTTELIQKIVNETNADAVVDKVSDIETILHYGIMSTPAIVVDEKVVHAGSIPRKEKIIEWLNS